MSETSNTPFVSKRSSPKNVVPLYDKDHPLDLSWREQAFCRGKDTSLFFPTVSETKSMATASNALQICLHCTVAHHCLFEAISYNYDGVWGGTIYKQRLYIIRTELNNDVSNLTLDKCKQFVQTTKIENVLSLSRRTRIRRHKDVPDELS